MSDFERICGIIRENLCLEESFSLNEEITFSELELDSLDVVEIIMAIEDSFGITIDDEELEDVKNLGELTQLVSQKEGI